MWVKGSSALTQSGGPKVRCRRSSSAAFSGGRESNTPTTSFSGEKSLAVPMLCYSRYMSEQDGFQGELAAALEKKASLLANDVLPKLQDGFRLFHSLFSNLYNLLYRKSLVQEDPYQYDRKLPELVLPSRGPIADSEKMEQLSRRLAEFQHQLEFLNGTYQFSLEFLGLERLKLLTGMVRYIDWSNLMTSSPDSNTSVLAEALGRIKLGADKISAGIVSDSSGQLAALTCQILKGLEEAAAWQRESYKLELRRRFFGRLGPELDKAVKAGMEQALPRLQHAFRQLEPEGTFHTELAREALAEDFSPDGPRLRAEALARLAVSPQPRAPAPTVDYRALLLEAVRSLVPTRLHLAEALAKLDANRSAREGRRRGFWARLLELFGFSRGGGSLEVLEIRQFDNATGVARPLRVNFPQFADQMRRKTALLEALGNAASTASVRLRAASEQEIHDFLDKNLAELHGLFRVMEGLDAFFKTGKKEEVRGIKIELAAIKNSLVRANKQRYEYTARKEEEKQRQQMGLA